MAFYEGGNPNRFRRYGKEVSVAEMVNGVITLPHGFLGEGSLPLWFHPNYSLVEDFICRNLKPSEKKEDPAFVDSDSDDAMDYDGLEGPRFQQQPKRRFHLVATPGIGKTYFGYYWFFKQAKEGKRVIWRTKGKAFLHYDFSAEEPFMYATRGYMVPVNWTDDMENIWLIVDGGSKVIDHDGPVLQCVSPDRAGYHEFSKDVGVLCHLEAWTLDELKQCRDALKLTFSDQELAVRFYYCGGLAREVLDQTKKLETLKGIMDKAVSRASDWKAVIRHADAVKDPNEEYLLHYRLDRNMVTSDRVAKYTLKFGSGYVEDLVHQQHGHQKARDFFDFCQGIPQAHNLSGTFFETYVHTKLEEGGGEYKGRNLVSPNDPTTVMSLKPTSHRRIRRWEISTEPEKKRLTVASKSERMRGQVEVMFGIYKQDTSLMDAKLGKEEFMGLASVPERCFVVPYSHTLQSLDSFLTPDIMIQCTYALDHKVYWKQVLEVVQEYDRRYPSSKPDFYRLIFIVPECQFRDFKFQNYKKEDGSDYVEPQPGMERVQQWALCFPW